MEQQQEKPQNLISPSKISSGVTQLKSNSNKNQPTSYRQRTNFPIDSRKQSPENVTDRIRMTRNTDTSKTLEDPILPKLPKNPRAQKKEPNTPAVIKGMLMKQDSAASTLKNTAKFGVIELDSIPVVDIDKTSSSGDPNE